MLQYLAMQKTPLNWLDPGKGPDMALEPLKDYRII